ncbi:hypothetical protein P280DRAFT_134904 [Massarina eburnea CBS 473.64]|uniref:Uncharacterized protein n=1 Tax=Massarina eburnea CBS 473.64 TaxID=1395130 RepID=A0A6A6RPB6_9PLEO|nr:hypothetical protein P280DRAFT_134904 [Massarina eburnea CBS 473.64]
MSPLTYHCGTLTRRNFSRMSRRLPPHIPSTRSKSATTRYLEPTPTQWGKLGWSWDGNLFTWDFLSNGAGLIGRRKRKSKRRCWRAKSGHGVSSEEPHDARRRCRVWMGEVCLVSVLPLFLCGGGWSAVSHAREPLVPSNSSRVLPDRCCCRPSPFSLTARACRAPSNIHLERLGLLLGLLQTPLLTTAHLLCDDLALWPEASAAAPRILTPTCQMRHVPLELQTNMIINMYIR